MPNPRHSRRRLPALAPALALAALAALLLPPDAGAGRWPTACVEICANDRDDDGDGDDDEPECVAWDCVETAQGGCRLRDHCREACNGRDDDGDGATDEVASVPCAFRAEHGGGVVRGATTCGGGRGAAVLRCEAPGAASAVLAAGGPGDPSRVPDRCDGVDNDLDGRTDEDLGDGDPAGLRCLGDGGLPGRLACLGECAGPARLACVEGHLAVTCRACDAGAGGGEGEGRGLRACAAVAR
jgi:hypothetical protein